MRDNVESRRKNVAVLIQEKRDLMARIQQGRSLLCIAEQIEHLEANLMITPAGIQTPPNMECEDFSDDSDADEGSDGISIRRLDRHAEQYLVLRLLLQRQSPSQSFVVNQGDRISKIKSILRLDVEGALKQIRAVQEVRPAATAPRIDRLENLLRSIDEKKPASDEYQKA